MNLVLFEPHEVDHILRVKVTGRRARHIRDILHAQSAQTLRAGLLNGLVGSARIEQITSESVEFTFQPELKPPPPAPIKLVLALPRPKVLRRVLANVTSLGIKEIYLIHAYRVEKPYWNSEQVQPQQIREACLRGLEQARDTLLPEVFLRQRFKPFVQDELPEIRKGTKGLVAHPGGGAVPKLVTGEPVTLVIGPEGGFIPFEVDLLQTAGFQPVQLGERILNVETAVSYAVGGLREW